MKTIVDFLKANKYVDGNIYKVGDVEFTTYKNSVMVTYDGNVWAVPQTFNGIEFEIQDILYDTYDVEIRFCEECHRPYDAGYMAGDGDYYCCAECFEPMMNRNYGEGKWKATDEEGYYGGFYACLNDKGKWVDTGFYYTEWNS